MTIETEAALRQWLADARELSTKDLMNRALPAINVLEQDHGFDSLPMNVAGLSTRHRVCPRSRRSPRGRAASSR